MFPYIEVGNRVMVDGRFVEVVKVTLARFWVLIDGRPVKFSKVSGREYGADADRQAVPFLFGGGGIAFFVEVMLAQN